MGINSDSHHKCLAVRFASINPIALGKAKIVYNFGLSECSRVKLILFVVVR